MTDQELIEQLAQKSEPAFKWLVESYQKVVFNTMLNIVQDEAEAEDGTQEVFIKIYESIAGFRQESALSTWIYRLTVNKALDILRRRKTKERLRQIVPWWMPEESKDGKAVFHHPGILTENKEKAAVLFKAINSLPEKQKIAFTLIKVQGMKYDEVSKIMDQHIKAIESLISRAKQNLQQKLKNI
ncbi:MAG: RNA polymerase sigma factor [Ferruginibacter sp.]